MIEEPSQDENHAEVSRQSALNEQMMGNFDCSIKSFTTNSLYKRKSSISSEQKSHNFKQLEKYEPSINENQTQNKVSDPKSVFNKVDINSISVRKFNLDGCEDP